MKDSLIESTITHFYANFVGIGRGTGNFLTVSQLILLAIRPPDVFIRVYTKSGRVLRGFQIMGSYLLTAHKLEILFWHSEKIITEYVIAYGLHVFDFKNIGCHSIVRFYMHGSFGINLLRPIGYVMHQQV